MKRIALMMFLVSVGCSAGPKSPEKPSSAAQPPRCSGFECGYNGTRLHGTAVDVSPRVEAVSTPE